MSTYKRMRRTKKKDKPETQQKGGGYKKHGITRTSRPFMPCGTFTNREAAQSAADEYTGTGKRLSPSVFEALAVKAGYAIVRVR